MSSRQVGRKLSFKLNKTVSELYSRNDESLSDEAFEEVKKNADRIKNYEIYYMDTPSTVSQMRELILECYKELNKPLVIFIDHARLVDRGNLSEHDMLTELSKMCMVIKKEIKCCIFLLSQLNRDIEKVDRVQNPQGHYPMRGDLFNSDAMYQASDFVGIIHRPELLNITDGNYGPLKLPVKDMVYLHLIKSRDGDLKIMQFKNVLKYNRLDEI